MDDHDLGLAHDLPGLLGRRRVLHLIGVAGAAALVGCAGDDDAATSSTSGATSGSTSTSTTASGSSTTAASPTTAAAAATTAATTEVASCTEIPEETAGPFPGDGSNGPDVLAESGAVRSDIRASFGSSTTVAEGVPMTINLTLVDTTAGCIPLSGAAVYVWHCDREGGYSMYSDGVEDENYLRGVQESDANGLVTFQSIFPAAYPGRWPHIHFEVYESVEAATSGGTRTATSQVALPEDASNAVYATAGYEQSVQNMDQTSLTNDNVFNDDGGVSQLAIASGDVTSGYTIALTVPV